MCCGAGAIRRGGGFTLIELLVVVMIFGILIGLVSVAIRPDEDSILRVEAERLAHLMDLAADESRYSGRPVAWAAEESSYRFWRWRERIGWIEVLEDDLLRPRQLPPGILISRLEVENRYVPGPFRLELAPHGQTFSYAIELTLGPRRYTVAASPLGDLRVRPGGHDTNDSMAFR
jgi:general secretion pathway protein H